MKLARITKWIDKVLDVKAFSDVSNNGVQIARAGDDVKKVAFGVDASVAFIEAAAEAGAQLHPGSGRRFDRSRHGAQCHHAASCGHNNIPPTNSSCSH